ncbi:RRP12-like protein [Eumeta japonica]|uniref:RRP12-like protein n=1 Tax=Eumeta variegata TaxID=151549 RepID=A0A4C1VKF6_EUMVA|nr:RRP12-like protein [Eumeta japonica]
MRACRPLQSSNLVQFANELGRKSTPTGELLELVPSLPGPYNSLVRTYVVTNETAVFACCTCASRLGNTGLTQEAVLKHDAIITYGHKTGIQKSDVENDLAIVKDFESMSVKSGEETESQYSGSSKSGTFKTFQTFASDWSQCSNISFTKLLTRFDSNNAVHKEMLAILAAVTEVIKEQGGKETTTEYFAALMETLKATEGEEGLVPTLSLLSMGIKSVPQPVLRKQFSNAASIFLDILEKYAQSENGSLLRSTLGCLSVLLRAQEYALWNESSTMKVFDAVLAFVLHSKPKVPKLHPASNRVAEFCMSQINAEALLSGHRSVLHVMTLLRDVLPVFSKENIKTVCESILSLMTHNNIYIKTCCLHVLHSLFSAPIDMTNLSSQLASQLTRALMAARPPANDSGQILAWTAVMQQGYGCLSRLDLNMCMPNLPAFVQVCVSELWLSDAADVTSSSTNALKAILLDCVKPAIDSDDGFPKYKSYIENILKTIGTGLDNPFNQAIKHVILTIAVCFEIGTDKVAYILGPLLKKLNERRESHNFENDKEVEYATGCAIKSLGPEFVLKCIPLRDGPDRINLDRSWLLPVMKEKIQNSNLKFFATDILEMATFCRKKSREANQSQDNVSSHTHELLCNQLWALLPSFCNNPKDIKDNFKAVAKVLGNVLKDNPEFRLSVMQALRKLIVCSMERAQDDDIKELARFAKNYLPILLNIYMSPAKGSTATGQRLAALETIQVYLTISDQSLLEELFTKAIQQLETSTDNHFQRESILDVIRLLVLYQNSEQIANLFDRWVYPLCETVLDPPQKFKKVKKEEDRTMDDGEHKDEPKKELKYKEKAKLLEMEHKKAYRILEEILKSDKEACKEFLNRNRKKVKKLLMSSLNKVADSSKAARLRCIELFVNSSNNLNAESKLLKCAVAESVICTRDINSKCRQCAYNLINSIGNILKDRDGGMESFIEMLLSGLEAPLPRTASASLYALASALYNFSEEMGLQNVQSLLEKVSTLMLSPNREVVERNDVNPELDTPIRGTSKTLEDILKDSDSEMEYLDEEEEQKPKAKKAKKSQAWIQDDPENIVDLADVSAARKITGTDPTQKKKAIELRAQKKNSGFKTAADGRLIITDDVYSDDEEEPKPSGDIKSESSDTEDETESKLRKPGTKRRYDDILSVRSERSNRSRASTLTVGSKYKAGGKGIHRPLNSAASVASTFGSEFKSKKGKGDIKKKGRHDPYAYLPLSRKNLNRSLISTKTLKITMINNPKQNQLALCAHCAGRRGGREAVLAGKPRGCSSTRYHAARLTRAVGSLLNG